MHKVWKFILLVFLPLIACNAWGQSRHALLIGIGNYPEDSGWNTIHGNNDITIIKAALVRQGFSQSNIIQLKDSSATKADILQGFALITSRCKPGDIVYIHFSGHGQQITDINGDEEDGFDEAWIPFDAKKEYEKGVYEGENHLIDDEINGLLKALRQRIGERGKIVVVADACHSGSGSRAEDDDELIVRGSDKRFISPDSSSLKQFVTGKNDWLFIAACKPYQTNYEHKTAGGSLLWPAFFYHCIRRKGIYLYRLFGSIKRVERSAPSIIKVPPRHRWRRCAKSERFIFVLVK